MSDEKKTVWFVQEGRMCSAWIIGHVDISVGVEDSESYTKPGEVLQNVLVKDCETIPEHNERTESVRKNVRIDSFVSRPGRWFFLSGMSVVHGDDCYGTREAAAEAYKKFLMEDE